MTRPDHVAALSGLIAGDRLLSVPGCWDGLTGLLIEQAGFPLAFLSGGALSMGRFGRPDIGLVTASELIETTAIIRDRIEIPLIVDGDTGFGNALTLQRLIRGLERAGASAVQIEDQGFPKRCGHMAGKTVVPLAEATGRVHAALDSRDHLLILARTDALGVEGLNSALDRAEAFLEAGADLIFIEGPPTTEELEAVATRFAARAPLVHNLVEGGITPTDSGADLEALGFRIALHPLLLLHSLVARAPALLATLKAEKSTTSLTPELIRLQDMNHLLDAAGMLAAGDRYA
ncbi:isocitrate lyase/PEP mutase family protein [Polymorphobacter sp.]|uniref:isocitrate lyase/PEP mutase family protein n=1 Tax=Polymorphobacter sp. TaxID=1909290 RepID=UPI003F6F9D4D